jgi:predicted flavoprotein YhiN
MHEKRIIVIGAGAGGLMATGRAAECGADVLLFEKTAHAGNKLLISGESRCNLSNTRELNDFITAFGPGGRFLYRAFNLFFRDELLEFLHRFGVETQAEADGRVFPASNSSADVLKAFETYLSENLVNLQTQKEVDSILVTDGRVTGVRTGQTDYPAAAVILATGGASYPATGSTGAGYRIAAESGHRIVKLRPALVPLATYDNGLLVRMQGASLSGVRLTAFACKAEDVPLQNTTLTDTGRGVPGKSPRPPIIESRTGDLIFTHFGLSGPVVLLMSLAVVEALESGPVSLAVDMRPRFTWEQLRQEIQQRFDRFSKRNFRNILLELLPPRLVDPFQYMSGVAAEKVGSQINAEERERLVRLMKALTFSVKGPLPLASAMVTAGGVSLDEIEPRTMASKLVKGLYFCGEVMDIDADTGGYNLQAAFSTGHLAGESAAAFVSDSKNETE